MTATLRGMAWDHPRARAPLTAITRDWSKHTGVAVHWDARPLKDFEDQPLEELAARYDLVLIDHPFVARAATSGLIVPVQDWADELYLADQAAHSVGRSYDSYTWYGKQWALAIDAACQVAAVREDLWQTAGLGALPRTWPEVACLASEHRDQPSRVAVPLNPNHAYCTFLSIGTTLAGDAFWPAHRHVDRNAALETLDFLRRLSADLHRASREADPIGISDLMSSSDEILYVPLMFGYSSYSRREFRSRLLRFTDAPRGSNGRIGSVLGGVGLAVSSCSAAREQAADLARLIAAPTTQAGLYVQAGGQPGHSAAWESAEANTLVNGFFVSTRETMEQAFMRPRVPGHRPFQPLAGALIHEHIWGGHMSAREVLKGFDDLVDTVLHAEEE